MNMNSWQHRIAHRWAELGFQRYVKVARYLQEGEETLLHGLARNEDVERLGQGQGEGFLVTTDRWLIFVLAQRRLVYPTTNHRLADRQEASHSRFGISNCWRTL